MVSARQVQSRANMRDRAGMLEKLNPPAQSEPTEKCFQAGVGPRNVSRKKAGGEPLFLHRQLTFSTTQNAGAARNSSRNDKMSTSRGKSINLIRQAAPQGIFRAQYRTDLVITVATRDFDLVASLVKVSGTGACLFQPASRISFDGS